MSRELIFLVSAPAAESGLPASVPCHIKVSPSGEGDPIVAFVSEDLGRQFVAGRALVGSLSVLAYSKLEAHAAKNLRAGRVLLFERSEQIAKYLKDGSNFDFARHIVSFEDATRRLQTAL